jgi:hypothetical protein
MQHKKNMGKKFIRLSFCRVLYVSGQNLIDIDHIDCIHHLSQTFKKQQLCNVDNIDYGYYIDNSDYIDCWFLSIYQIGLCRKLVNQGILAMN